MSLVAGLGELAYFAYVHDIGAHTRTRPTLEAAAFLTGVLTVMTGLIVAGPWLTLLAARLSARRATRPAGLIAARRLADNPHAAFRAISGLALAIFVGTCAIGIITAISAANGGVPGGTPQGNATLVEWTGPPVQPVTLSAVPAATSAALRAVPGVTGLLEVRERPNPDPSTRAFDPVQTVVSCAQLATAPAFGRCPPGARVVAVEFDYSGTLPGRPPLTATTWPALDVPDATLARLAIDTVAVPTDGTPATVEQARTVLDGAFDTTFALETVAELRADGRQQLDGYRRLADVVILLSLPIAGCSLAVSVAGGLADRKRPFSLLRLAGAPLSMLRRVITVEAAAPLLAVAAASVAVALLTAQLFLRAQLHETLLAPSLAYWGTVIAGLLASLAVVASTLPLLDRLTGPETARND